MPEIWREIEDFPGYSVSNYGRIRSGPKRILALNENREGVVQVGMMRNGVQRHRSVPRLVAQAFLSQPTIPFNTPINLDGDRSNNSADNLAWRPRWFARRYNQQFKFSYDQSILSPLEDLETGEVTENSFECAKRYGLLESDIIFSILNRTYVWPTYQEFRTLEV